MIDRVDLRQKGKGIQAMQREINAEKVQSLCDKGYVEGRLPGHLVPIILVAGNDGMMILDGHHRSFAEALCAKDPTADVLIIRSDKAVRPTVRQLLSFMPETFFAGHKM